MAGASLTSADKRLIQSLLSAYVSHNAQIELFQKQLLMAIESNKALMASVHSVRSRLKAPDHLEEKLTRKICKCKKENSSFDINPGNLFVKINDLAGVRLLHLYTRQITSIDLALREVFKDGKYELLEGPKARTWDDESRQFFKGCNIETQDSPSLYTSVHYVISSASRTTFTAEIQVRTLMEEVWGEVDHAMNYPHPTDSVPCREQIKVLARVTSRASRLVDSIFTTFDHHVAAKKNPAVRAIRKQR